MNHRVIICNHMNTFWPGFPSIPSPEAKFPAKSVRGACRADPKRHPQYQRPNCRSPGKPMWDILSHRRFNHMLCMYIYIYIYILNIYIYWIVRLIWIIENMQTSMHKCRAMYIYIYTYTYIINDNIITYIYVCKHNMYNIVQLHMYIYIHIYIYMHTIHMYICIYAYNGY